MQPQHESGYLFAIAILFSLSVSVLFVLDLHEERTHLNNSFLHSAQAHFRSIILTRRWNAEYGGVYVEKRPGVASNPYLTGSDIHASNGKSYALRNPALMTREISALADQQGLFRFHITSLKLRNPDNAPDDWERTALLAFENAGQTEAHGHEDQGGKTYFRYMAPLRVEPPCLKCHEDMGYKLGEIRGGISVSFDISDFLATAHQREWRNGAILAFATALVWLLTVFLMRRYTRRIAELSLQYRDLLHSTDGVVWEADARSFKLTFISEQAERLFGFSVSEWMKPGFWVDHLHPEDREWATQYRATCTDLAQSYDFEYRFIAQNGRTVWLHDIVSLSCDNEGRPATLHGMLIDITSRKESALTEQTLLKEKEAILDNALVGIVFLKDRIIASCNRRFEEIFGYGPGELLGKSTAMLYATPALFEEVGKRAYDELGQGHNFNEEILLRRKDQSVFWGAITGRALDPAHSQAGSIWIYADISERKLAEEENQKLLRAVEQSSISIVITNRNAEIEYVNPRFTQVTGYSRREAMGQNPNLLQSGETPAETYREMWQNLLGGKEWRGILRNRRKSGELFWEEASISPILDEHGEITHFIAVKEDISDRYRLEEQRRFFELLAEQAPAPMYALEASADYPVAYVNQATADHFGRPRDEILRQHLKDWDPEYSANSMADLVRLLKSGGSATFETKQILANGDAIPVEVFARYVEFEQKGYVIGFFRDITERLAKARELVENQALLERIVTQRTQQLTEALSASRVAEKAKDEFLANMSHEIRTPLNAILGLSGLALRPENEPRRRDFLEKIANAGESLLGTVNDLLDLSKIAAGHLELEQQPLQLVAQVTEIVSLMGHKATEKGLVIETRMDPNLPEQISGDALRIRQILLNLLGNAIKFTQQGRITIEIDQLSQDPAGVTLQIRVSDTGVGMTPEEVGRIFQAFAQADNSITRKYGGTGLGLAICKRLCQLMQGDISVSSTPGKGSTFAAVIRLGRVSPADMARAARSESIPQPQALPKEYRQTRILIVEDHPVNQTIASELLALVNIQCEIANDGAEGVDLLLSHSPDYYDCVLMDIQMPIMDGLTAVAAIRNNPDYARLPIIAVTAHVMAHERERSIQAGMSDLLGKPFKPDEMYRVVARWVSRDKQVFDATPAALPPHDAAAPLDLPGVDWVDALARFGGSREKYLYWLNNFLASWPAFEADVKHSLESGDFTAAHHQLHGFKGKCGALGVSDIFVLSAHLDDAIRTEAPWTAPWTALWQDLQTALPATRQRLLEALANKPRIDREQEETP